MKSELHCERCGPVPQNEVHGGVHIIQSCGGAVRVSGLGNSFIPEGVATPPLDAWGLLARLLPKLVGGEWTRNEAKHLGHGLLYGGTLETLRPDFADTEPMLYVVCATDQDGRVMEFVELEDEQGKSTGPSSGVSWRKWRGSLQALGPFRPALPARDFGGHKTAIDWVRAVLWSPVDQQPPTYGDYLVWWCGGEWRATWVPASAAGCMPAGKLGRSRDVFDERGTWILRDRKIGFLWWKKPLRIRPTHWRQVNALKPEGEV